MQFGCWDAVHAVAALARYARGSDDRCEAGTVFRDDADFDNRVLDNVKASLTASPRELSCERPLSELPVVSKTRKQERRCPSGWTCREQNTEA